MSMVQLEAVGAETLERAQSLLADIPGGVDKAVRSAMSRSVSHLRTNSARAVRERYDIKAADIRANENVTVRYSYREGVQVTVTFAGRKIPLHRYGGAAPGIPTQDASVTLRALVGGGWRMVHPSVPARGHQLKSTSPTQFQRAFVAQMESGHIGIFERTGGKTAEGKDAIRELMGSSVPQMLGSTEVQEKLAAEAAEKFEERLNHEIMAILNGWH